MRIAGYVQESIVDGDGVRFVVFGQGCPHHCPGCHNPETHDPSGGYEISTDEIMKMIKRNPLLSGVTLSGGEPFVQVQSMAELARSVHEFGLNVWVYSGYTLEELQENPNCHELLAEADVLVDGPYIEDLRDEMLKFRGSSNQRITKMC